MKTVSDRRSEERYLEEKEIRIYISKYNKIFKATMQNKSKSGFGLEIPASDDLVGDDILIIDKSKVYGGLVVRQSYGTSNGSFIGVKISCVDIKTLRKFSTYVDGVKIKKRKKLSYYSGTRY